MDPDFYDTLEDAYATDPISKFRLPNPVDSTIVWKIDLRQISPRETHGVTNYHDFKINLDDDC